MSHVEITRHMSIINTVQHNPPIHIIGAGATGSHLWMTLIELGFTNITVYDFDTIASHNLANQLFNANQVGQYKVHALAELYKLKTGKDAPETLQFINAKVTGEEPMAGIIFLLTDTMESRRQIMQGIVNNKLCPLVIETRLASSYGNVFTVNPFDNTAVKQWFSTLVKDEDAEASPCGASITVGPTVKIIANMAVWQLINFLTDQTAVDQRINITLKPVTCGAGKYV